MPLNSIIKKDTAITFLIVLCYGLFIYCLEVFLFKTEITSVVPEASNLAQWDAGIYHKAANIGYYYKSEADNNAGIYVLFPWVWRLLHVGVLGICIANLIFFAAGFTIITKIFPVTTNEKLLWLSTPSLYFMWVPYSEALFCLLTTITFYGIVKKNKWTIWVSLFLLSLCRPTAVFFIPALFVMELLTNSKEGISKIILNYFLVYAVPLLIGALAFIMLQYYCTGVWFPYYIVQSKYLSHDFAMPILPFSDYYGGARIRWISALAIIPCIVSLVIILVKVYRWSFKNEVYTNKIWIMTVSYLPIVLFTMVFCNPIWGSLTTNLMGIHRYVFCSPFFFIFLYNTIYKPDGYKLRDFIIVFIACNLVWLSMGSYSHIQHFLYYNFCSLLVIGYMLHANKKNSWAILGIFAINIIFQISLFEQFMKGLFTE